MNHIVAILGSGNMGTALALHLAKQGHPVRIYCIDNEVERQINTKHRNDTYLPGIVLPAAIRASADLSWCVSEAKAVIMAVPSFAAASVMAQAKKHLSADAIVASITKGLDPDSLEPNILTQQKLLPTKWSKRLCMLGGPAIAGELAQGALTAFVVAGNDAVARGKFVRLFTSKRVKVAPSGDLKGVGLASALKNAYAIALGMCDGLDYPTNAKAFVMTLAVTEMADMLHAAGADTKTASSLAGLGDMLVTGWSPHGRNRRYGEKLVHAHTKDPHKLGLKTVEGIAAAESGVRLAKKLRVKAPLLQAIDRGLKSESHFHRPFTKYLTDLKF